jgi:hypothetical protein
MKIAEHIVAVVMLALISGTVVADDLPDLGKTPGTSRPGLTKKAICATLWGKDERHVTAAMKKEAFSRYGYTGYSDPRRVADSYGKTCEIDHLVSRELGGGRCRRHSVAAVLRIAVECAHEGQAREPLAQRDVQGAPDTQVGPRQSHQGLARCL